MIRLTVVKAAAAAAKHHQHREKTPKFTSKERCWTNSNNDLKKWNWKLRSSRKKAKKAVSTKAQMDFRIAKRREKRKQKEAMLEAKLAENTIEMKKLKNFAKKRKLSM